MLQLLDSYIRDETETVAERVMRRVTEYRTRGFYAIFVIIIV